MPVKGFHLLTLLFFCFFHLRPSSALSANPTTATFSALDLKLSSLDYSGLGEQDEFDLNRIFSEPITLHDGLATPLILAVDEVYQVTVNGAGQVLKITESTQPADLAAAAETLFGEFRQDVSLVFYPLGAPRSEQTRIILSREVLVQSNNREETLQAATAAGLLLKKEPGYAPGFFVFSSASPAQSVLGTARLRSQGFSAQALPYMQALPLSLPDDPLFPYQWHIRGRGQNGAKKSSDARITPAWELQATNGARIRGTGITIGIVDDGVQMDHPDLSNNISSTYRRNWNFGSEEDPSPYYTSDNHGTAVAGVAAAVGFNGLGVAGAAPSATIAPMRFISDLFTDADEADMYAYGAETQAIRVKNNSWGLGNSTTALTSLGYGLSFSSVGWSGQGRPPGYSLSSLALASAANDGQVILFAAGNGLAQQENVNFRGRQNSIYVLAVAAVNDQGRQTDYSTPGAAVVIAAPSGGDVYNLPSSRPQGTSTTDRTSEDGYNNSANATDYSDRSYTDSFNGTSSACPVASGVTALVLQARPNLNWRDVKEIYIRSATRNDSGDSDWSRNGAGFWFNHKYGAGLINAYEAVRLAKNWTPLAAMTNFSVGLGGLEQKIRDNNSAGVTKFFDTRGLQNLRVEHATVTVDIAHASRGELEIQLISPAGTTSRLAEVHASYPLDPANYPNWTFSTVHNWGENFRGLWRLRVADRVSGNTGTLNSTTLTLYGTEQ